MVRNRQTSYFVGGIILMGLGGLFLFTQFLGGTFWSYFWPYLIILAGLTFFVGMMSIGRGAGGLAIPGTIVTTIGSMLFIQNLLGWWESWSFGWTVIIIATGIGIYLMGVWNYSEKAKRRGLNIAAIGAILLLIFGTFFGIGFSFLGFGFAARIIWPLAMIVVGAFLVMRWGKVLKQGESSSLSTATNAEPKTENYAIVPVENTAIVPATSSGSLTEKETDEKIALALS